jgi:hypothetical protein
MVYISPGSLPTLSITSSYIGSVAFITIISNADISGVNWTVGNVNPNSTTLLSLPTGLYGVILKYPTNLFISLSLSKSSGRTNYRGSDLVDYLATKNSLGVIVADNSSDALVLGGLSAVLASLAIIGGIIVNK